MNEYENSAYEKGFRYVCGTDEAGRGPLAGPVVAAAVMFPRDYHDERIDDSKKLSPKKRELLAKEIMAKAISWQVAVVDAGTIDKINIYEASRLAMTKAVLSLDPSPDFILTDAMPLNVDIAHLAIIKGDQKSISIAAASILAKVCRDHLMMIYDHMYPQYEFARHKGYPTKRHLELLEKYGPCPIHRRSYRPVAQLTFDFSRHQ